MKKMLFVMNPYSGMRRAVRYLADIISMFNRAGFEVITHMTGGQGDAEVVVRATAPRVDLVVCCGGDGTFNETISGILKSGADVPVGYIPAGSTNDFASSLRLSTNILQAVKDILEGEPVSYDVGKFGERYFSYVASFGAFTRASYATPQNVKNALGHTAYLLGGIQELSQIRKIHARLELDDTVLEDDYLFGAVCNSTSLAGILTLDSTQVDMADGQFEVLLVRRPGSLAEVRECIQAIQNKTYDCGMVTFRSAKTIRVTMDEPVDWTLDGEYQPGATQIEIQNLHRAIQIFNKE